MKRNLLIVPAVLAMALAIGCEKDFYAKQIIVQNTDPGKVLLELAGSPETLIKQGRIDFHRQVLAPDGTNIDVWVIKAKLSTEVPRALGTMILLHGLGESKASFPIFGVGERLAKKGYDVVLPDLRAHGRSGGRYITYGALEKLDIKAVIDHLAKEGSIHTPVYVFGTNLGGSVAIQYAAIDERCKGVMAVAPYKGIASVGWTRVKLMAPAMSLEQFQQVLARAGQIGQFDPAQASAVAAARQLKCPLLLVHGILDLSVPLEHSKAIYEAAMCPKKLETPTFEIFVLPAILEDWIAGRLDKLAKTGVE